MNKRVAPASSSSSSGGTGGGRQARKAPRLEITITPPEIAEIEHYLRCVQEADMESLSKVAVPPTSITKYVAVFDQKASRFLNIGKRKEFTFTSLIMALVRFPKSLRHTLTAAWSGEKPKEEDLPFKCCWVKDHRLYVVKPLFEYYMDRLWREVDGSEKKIDSNMKANGFMCCRIYSTYHRELGIYHPPAKMLIDLHKMDPQMFHPVDIEYMRSLEGVRGKGHVCECQAPQVIGAIDSRTATNIMAAASVLGTTPASVAAGLEDPMATTTAAAAVSVAAAAAATTTTTTLQLPVRMQRPESQAMKWAMITPLTKLTVHISGPDVKAYRQAIDLSLQPEWDELLM